MVEALGNERKYILPTTTAEWTCTICKRAILCARIYQCRKGHLSCSVCHKIGKCCTLCPNKAPSNIRNLAVETIIESMEMTCQFAPLGCNVISKFKEESESWEHEDNCSFHPMECPMPGCFQVGEEPGFPEHLLTKHNISSLVYFEDESGPCDDAKFAGKFELKPSTSLILLRMPSDEEVEGWAHYLLHQGSTTYVGRNSPNRNTRRQISLHSKKDHNYGKPTFKVEVLTSDKDGTYLYSFRSKCTSSKQQGGMLIIPKQPVGDAFKCKVTLLEDDEVDF